MPMATIHKVGSGELYHIHFLDQHGTDPGYGQGRPGMEHPGNRPPGSGNRPDQGLPGHEGGTDPGYGQGRPRPGIPSNELPDQPPPNLAPGWTLVLIRHDGKWQYAAIAPGSPPPRPLPNPPETGPGQPNLPNQGLPGAPPGMGPGQPNLPNQGLPNPPTAGQPLPPGGMPPHPSGQPVPPMPTPVAR